MGSDHTTQWSSVEQWSPTLFLVGGSLLIGHAAMSAVHAFTDIVTPPDAFVTTGHFVALVGLLGLYPVLANRTPRLARAAAATGVVALVSWFVMTVVRFFELAGIVSSLGDALPDVFFVIVLASTILTYGLFGVATLRIDSSRSIGLLVLVPSILTAALVVDSVLTGVSALDGVFIGGGLALSMMALGYTLRTWDRPTDHAASPSDVVAG
ncbi:hypothetical protein [Natronomonas sp. EA1]|uniref:hypothetical protein n=1 Tax=Natronomonas sp. EA1 TaxID=3421655 RepID=UPI003EB7DE59